jgi:glutathione synthase/RimK-type ligase-like ATP-grasp enzyme
MPFILYSKQTSVTGRYLARYLRIRGGTNPPDTAVDWLIRWGSTTRVPRRPENVLNKRASLFKALDKYEFLNTGKELGIPVPPVTVIENAEQFSFPCLARKKTHMQGRDIRLCMQLDDVASAAEDGAEYLVKYIPTKAEYRVHVFRDTVIKTSLKVLAHPDKYVPWVRNLNSGYVFQYPGKDNVPRGVRATAKMAVQLMDLDFGAVDLLVSDDGRPIVLEINTGPGLAASGVKKYGDLFAELTGITNVNEGVLNDIRPTAEDVDDTE